MYWKESVLEFEKLLHAEEKSGGTIEKYMRDVRTFLIYIEGREWRKENIIAYKGYLAEKYAASTANTMLVAMNRFFDFINRRDLQVKPLKVQRKIFSRQEKELSKGEYIRLVQAAERKGDQQLALILQTICATGIRVSELQFITVEALYAGRAEVRGKGKQRVIFIPKNLKKMLMKFIKCRGVKDGSIFITKRGRPIERTNVWSKMKKLCEAAGVRREKVFPHNLRHLFARVFYGLEKDIAKLADILGHSSIETTRIYIMESGERHLERMERMNLVINLRLEKGERRL